MLKGIDISAWQSVESVDESLDFVIVKATQGTDYVSPVCDAQYQRAKAQGKLLGVYHYASGGDPTEEADFFLKNIQGYIGEAVLVLDWESNQNACFWEHASWCQIFLDRVYAKTGVRPLIYMSASVTTQADWSNIARNYGLWVAGYPDLRDSWDIPDFIYTYIPYWEDVAIWQYTNSNGRLDRDVAYMDRNAWKSYARSETKKEEVKTEPAKEPQVEPTLEEPVEKPVEKPVENIEETISAPKCLTSAEYLELIEKSEKSVEVISSTLNQYGIKIKMSDNIYNMLNITAKVILPMINTIFMSLATIWNIGFSTEINATIALVIASLNALLGITVEKAKRDYNT